MENKSEQNNGGNKDIIRCIENKAEKLGIDLKDIEIYEKNGKFYVKEINTICHVCIAALQNIISDINK